MKQKQIPLAPGGRPKTAAKRSLASKPDAGARSAKSQPAAVPACSDRDTSQKENGYVQDPVPLAAPAPFPSLTEAQYRGLRQQRRAYLVVMLAAMLAFASVVWTVLELEIEPTAAGLVGGLLLICAALALGYSCVGRWTRILHCPACDVKLWDSDPERNCGLFGRACPHCHKPFPPRRGFG
jgi:hypothetical protein